jgi:hypothetical protein
MRTLIVVPIIHTEQDMGSLITQIKREYIARFGHEKWCQHLKSIDEVWQGIRQMITVLELPYQAVHLYQDGLPICGKEIEIVNDLAAQGSTNHQLLAELMQRGATLQGTEDAQLLLQEYRFHQGDLRDTSPEHEPQRSDLSRKLLLQRDHFIAGRINATLATGQIGLLFLGLAHSVESLLDADILVRHLLPALQEKQGKIREKNDEH